MKNITKRTHKDNRANSLESRSVQELLTIIMEKLYREELSRRVKKGLALRELNLK